MGIEIERKFLVKNDQWKALADKGLLCRQGYFVANAQKSVRVRVMGSVATLTIKGATEGIVRAEFEYEIPLVDAEALLLLCGDAVVEKRRYQILRDSVVWELDVFSGKNEGLVLAEVELESVDQRVDFPDWLGIEVSADARYFNGSLALRPFDFEWMN